MKPLRRPSFPAERRICHQNFEIFLPTGFSSSAHTLCRNCQKFPEKSANMNFDIASFAENSNKDLTDEMAKVIREKFDEIQDHLDQATRRLDFEIEVFCQEENNHIENKDVSPILDQLSELDFSPGFFEAYEKTEKFDETFVVEGKDDEDILQNNIQENLERLKDDFYQALEPLNLKALYSGLMRQISRLYRSKSEEAIFLIIMKTIGLFEMKMDDDEEGVLKVSCKKGNRLLREVDYNEVKYVEKVDLKIESIESIEKMIFGLNSLLENCLKKVLSLKFSFTRRFISNQEGERISNCTLWKKKNIKYLTLDWTKCTFESEETPLIFFSGRIMEIEGLEGFKCFLGDTNVAQTVANDLNQLVRSRFPMIQCFGVDYSNLLLVTGVSSVGFNGLRALDLNVRNTAFNDEEIICFSEKVLSGLKDLSELKLWVDNTQVTDKGLLRHFKSVKDNCASQLKAFVLGLSETNVTDESFEEFAGSVLPLMKNLVEFKLFISRTLMAENTLFTLCKNIKHFASTLKIFALDIAETAATDKMMNAFSLVSLPLMKKLEMFKIKFSGTKITDQSLYNFYSSMSSPGLFSNVKELEFGCSEVEMTNQTFSFFANKVLPKMAKLRKFTFYANKTKLGDSSLKSLFKNLSIAKSQLRILNISLDETEIGKGSILALAESVISLINLTHLSLQFNQTKLENSSFSRLFSSLKSFARNLESLRFGLNDTQITDQGISVLGNEIAPEMISLKELRLGLSRTQISDLSLKPLFENLNETMDLQLCLNGTLITDQSLLALANNNLTSLKSFELLVAKTEISDLSILPLMQNLNNKLCDCNKLALSFRKTKATDEAIWAFTTYVLVGIRNLQDFSLSFGGSQVVDPTLFWFFCNLITKLPRIRCFELEFCEKINDLQVQLFAYLVLPNFTQTLQTFKVNWKTANLDPSTFRAICFQALNSFENLKSFHLSSSSLQIINTQKCLKELHFELNEVQMTDFIMHEILSKFQDKVSHVKNFSFLVKGTQVASRSIKTLANNILSSMQELEGLTINFDNIAITDQDFCSLCRSMEVFAKNLKLFKINLGIRSISHSSILSLTKFGLRKMINLEKLYLDFNSNRNIEQSLGVLFTCLQNCAEKLKAFSLSLTDLELLPEAIDVLAISFFPILKNLENFHLGLYETGITDSEFLLLFSGLKEEILRNMTSFTLGIHEQSLTDQAFDVLSSDILPRLRSVETFGCYFANNENITDEGLIRFCKRLKDLSGQIVNLIFRFENMEILNESASEFALKTLCEMKNMKDLDISFGFTSVNDEGIGSLFCGIGKIIEGLNSLQLGLQSTTLTNVSFEVFKEQILPKLGSLKRLSLDFSENFISEENQNFVKNILRKYQ